MAIVPRAAIAMAVLLSAHEIAFVAVAVGGRKHAMAVEFSVHEVAFVAVAVDSRSHASALEFSVSEVAFVAVAVGGRKHAMAVEFSFHDTTFVAGAIDAGVHALAVKTSIHEVAFVAISIGGRKHATAVEISVQEVAFVAVAIGGRKHAMAVPPAVHEVAFVPVATGGRSHAMAMYPAVHKVAFVLVAWPSILKPPQNAVAIRLAISARTVQLIESVGWGKGFQTAQSLLVSLIQFGSKSVSCATAGAAIANGIMTEYAARLIFSLPIIVEKVSIGVRRVRKTFWLGVIHPPRMTVGRPIRSRRGHLPPEIGQRCAAEDV